LCVVGDASIKLISIGGRITAYVSTNTSGGTTEIDTPYSEAGSVGETELLFTRTYNADSGYYLTSALTILVGNSADYLVAQTPTYDVDSNLTNMTYSVSYTYPAQDITGDYIEFKVAATEIFTQTVEITSIPYSGWYVPQMGLTRGLNVFGVEGATYSITATDGTDVLTIATNVVMDASGYQQQSVTFPETVAARDWTFTYSGDIAASVTPDPLVIPQLGMSEIIFEPKPSSIFNGGFDVERQFTSISSPEVGSYSSIATIDWAINSVDGDPMTIFTSLPDVVWEGNESVVHQTSGSSGTTLVLDDTTDITPGMRFNPFGAVPSLLAYTVVSVDSATDLTVTPGLTIPVDIGITFTNDNGFNVTTTGLAAVYSNPDQSAITISGDIVIDNYGDTDMAMQLDFSDWVNIDSPISCGTTTSGAMDITNNNIDLSPSGGLIAFLVNSDTIPNKFEIVHNGAKRATSGITSLNSGSYDNVYGNPPSNTIPTNSQSLVVDQFIGSAKGAIPTREAAFTAETSNTIPSMTVGGVVYQQIVWLEYTAADYIDSPFAQIRTTGSPGATWDILRLCCPDINCTGASPSAPTLTTVSITGNTTTTLDTGGTLISDNGSAITSRDIHYGTDPLLATWTVRPDGNTGTSDFAATITGLAPCTTYYMRAVATNGVGIGFGNIVSGVTMGCP
jgi:hypothetical protein